MADTIFDTNAGGVIRKPEGMGKADVTEVARSAGVVIRLDMIIEDSVAFPVPHNRPLCHLSGVPEIAATSGFTSTALSSNLGTIGLVQTLGTVGCADLETQNTGCTAF